VEGPGVVFTNWGEKIIAEVDLRRQVRVETDVSATTSDSIEIKTNVITTFSLSDAPDIMTVAYFGGKEKENLVALDLVENKEMKTIAIRTVFKIDPDDAPATRVFSRLCPRKIAEFKGRQSYRKRHRLASTSPASSL
jgi:hypothetical protein